MNLLFVDNGDTSKIVSELRNLGHQIETCTSLAEGLMRVKEKSYDFLLVDLALAYPAGFPILKHIAAIGQRPFCVVTGEKENAQARVQALDLAADACLIKPYELDELLATLRSLQRRGVAQTQNVYRIADLELDLIRQSVVRGNRKLDLTPKEFSLLSFLVRRSGEILSRSQISEYVWDTQDGFDTNIVDVHIRRLRSKVDDPYTLKLIQTVRGMGYVLKQPGFEAKPDKG